MADLTHVWGNDLSFSPSGDLAVSDIPEVTTQRVLRRLLTNKNDYLWHLKYGAGLPAMVGQPVNVNAIRAIILGQMLREAGVAQIPPPQVTVSSSQDNTVYASVIYADATTGQTQVLTVPVSGP